MMAQIEDKYSVTDIKEKPLKKKIKALWLEKFKKLKKFVSKTLKIKISRPVFSAAIVASRVTIEKASSHPEKHQDNENHQNENSIFADESVIRPSELEHQTTATINALQMPYTKPKPSESLIAHGQRPKLRNEAEVARKSRCFWRKDGACLSAQPPKPSSPRPREDPTKPTLEIQHYNSKPIQFIS
ncbi:hypothetical protein OUZ56_011342 [Daphnia magna]|uniref:Uncharacterized protein n=1 Tax=Daphnia magna TaxID=35525 RepID=A0ABQ9YZW7_9CRUS|nr:hypothetical protein OUZ56_011342 [Daphnia magna]